MNKLVRKTLEQHKRVRLAGTKGHAILKDAIGEIMQESTPEALMPILEQTAKRSIPSSRRGPLFIDFAAQRLYAGTQAIQASGTLIPYQGYIGLVAPSHDLVLATHSSGIHSMQEVERIMGQDPIQAAVDGLKNGEFYPGMSLGKTLCSEAYNNRGWSARKFSPQQWLANLAGEGILQGTIPLNINGTSGHLAATGLMPSDKTMTELNGSPIRAAHISGEITPAFKASGLCDRAALDCVATGDIITVDKVTGLADEILDIKGGSLN